MTQRIPLVGSITSFVQFKLTKKLSDPFVDIVPFAGKMTLERIFWKRLRGMVGMMAWIAWVCDSGGSYFMYRVFS
jgi:hypothetical protein